MRHDPRQCEIQTGLFQPRVEQLEWKAVPAETKQAVIPLLVELLKEAAAAKATTKAQEVSND